MLVYLLLAVAALAIVLLVYPPVRKARTRRTLVALPFPPEWRQLLQRRWLLYRHLPKAVRHQLHRKLRVMMAETVFYGCNGLTVTDEMRLMILAQAALACTHTLPGKMPVVLVYPDAFVREDEVADELGLVARERLELLGESWQQGRVILSWVDVEQDLHQLNGHNLVIHEYAHQLDGRDGAMNGAPPLASQAQYQRWTLAMQSAYDDLCQLVEQGEVTEVDAYAATNPEEFFAVVSEYFFTSPQLLHQCYPAVYRVLAGYYRMAPLAWGLPEGDSG